MKRKRKGERPTFSYYPDSPCEDRPPPPKWACPDDSEEETTDEEETPDEETSHEKVPGVRQIKTTGLWYGQVHNPLKRTATGGRKTEHTPCFATKAEAIAARNELYDQVRREIKEHYDPIYTKLAAEDPLTRGLERAPENILEAKPNTKYWHASYKTCHLPKPCVRVVAKREPSGFKWEHACHECPAECAQVAFGPGVKSGGKKPEFCEKHGGGLRCAGLLSCFGQCPHGMSVQQGARGAKYEQGGKRYCPRCFCDTFPDDARARQASGWLHAKEQAVAKFLTEMFPEYVWTLDKGYGYKLRAIGQRRVFRPDARVDVNKLKRVIIVEVDEKSHREYFCPGERERETAFVKAAGEDKTVVLIRFNPDKYTKYDGKRVTTCWQYSKVEGKMSVAPRKTKEWAARLEELRAMVANFLDPETPIPPPQEGRPCFTAELFYDNVAEQQQQKQQQQQQ